MSKKTEGKSTLLIPSTRVEQEDGTIVFVPNGPDENKRSNMVLASQVRNLIQENIKMYKQAEARLSPKELKDLADAAAAIAKFSAEVYSNAEPIRETGIKHADKVQDVIGVDMSSLIENKDEDPTGEKNT